MRPDHQELLSFNRRGLICAPEETEEAFFGRARREEPLPHPLQSLLVKKLFDIDMDWIRTHYSSKGLRFWEGGCTWIEGTDVTLQLQPRFEKKKSYRGYSQDEVVAHELVHVARLGFDEPIFEEVLAYQTSGSPLRRYFGPIFRTSKESLIFMCGLLGCLGAAFFEPLYFYALFALGGLFTFGMGRLIRTQHIFEQARQKIGSLVGDDKALAVMLRLTDREIIRFARAPTEEIVDYFSRMSKTVRWQQLMAYFGSF